MVTSASKILIAMLVPVQLPSVVILHLAPTVMPVNGGVAGPDWAREESERRCGLCVGSSELRMAEDWRLLLLCRGVSRKTSLGGFTGHVWSIQLVVY